MDVQATWSSTRVPGFLEDEQSSVVKSQGSLPESEGTKAIFITTIVIHLRRKNVVGPSLTDGHHNVVDIIAEYGLIRAVSSRKALSVMDVDMRPVSTQPWDCSLENHIYTLA